MENFSLIPARLNSLICRLAELPYVDKIILFGSRARGDARPRSDIDLAVSAPGATSQQWVQLVDLVQESPTLLAIDLIWYEEAGEELKTKIRQEGKVLYDRSESDTESRKS